MMTFYKYAAMGIAAFVFYGCASGVKRDPEYGAPAASKLLTPMPVGNLTITLSSEAKKLAADNPKFKQEHLLASVRRALDAGGLLRPGTSETAEIVVTAFRVRGTFSAVMWGVMAGTDNVTGDVVVRNANGKQVRKFTVNASYGLGGFAGGVDDTRLGWLYEKFAEHTVEELGGQRKE